MNSECTLLDPEAILLHAQCPEPSTDHVGIGRFIISSSNALDIIQEADQAEGP
jgi:hypothetical protein